MSNLCVMNGTSPAPSDSRQAGFDLCRKTVSEKSHLAFESRPATSQHRITTKSDCDAFERFSAVKITCASQTRRKGDFRSTFANYLHIGIPNEYSKPRDVELWYIPRMLVKLVVERKSCFKMSAKLSYQNAPTPFKISYQNRPSLAPSHAGVRIQNRTKTEPLAGARVSPERCAFRRIPLQTRTLRIWPTARWVASRVRARPKQDAPQAPNVVTVVLNSSRRRTTRAEVPWAARPSQRQGQVHALWTRPRTLNAGRQ